MASGNLPTIQWSLNGGELSPRMESRSDQNKRLSGLSKCENWLPLTIGGVRRREGSVFVARCKVIAGHTIYRSMAFRASNDASYVLELGYHYMRFYRNGAQMFSSPGVPLEIETPYNDTDLAELNGEAQSIDVKYLFHRKYPPYKLTRITATSFVFAEVLFNSPATIEEEPTGTNLGGGTLTPGAVTGTGVTFTASADAPFLLSDVGRLIVSGAGRALIVTRPTTTTVTANILDPFASTAAIPASNWRLRLSPQTEIDVEIHKTEVGETVLLQTPSLAGFRSQDVGKWVSVFGGQVQINTFNNSSSVTGTIKAQLKDIDESADPSLLRTRAWSLDVNAWTAALGYPSCGTFSDERLWIFKGLTVNGSVVGDFENFAKGGSDSDAIARTISDDDIDPIVWAKGMQTLIVGTGSGAFEIRAAAEGQALTPSNCNIKPISARGSARIPPVRIGSLLHYVQLGQRRIREIVFDFTTNRFKSPNIFQFAEHLTESFFLTELFYAAEPDSQEYAIRSDGALLALVYQEEESVMGWAPCSTNGKYKSGCVIPRPSTGKDWIWTIVSRENGYFMEYFEPNRMNPNREWNECETDSAVFATHDEDFVVSGLDHLEGQTVRVIGDGLLYDDAVVEDGEITLSPQIACNLVEVGLDFKSLGLTLEPVVPVEAGGPFISASYLKIGAKVRRSLGLTLNGEQLDYRKPLNAMDKQVPLQKGKVKIANLGYDAFSRIAFEQNLPFPAEVMNIAGVLHVGDQWKVDTEDDATPPFAFITSPDIAGNSGPFTIDFVINTNQADWNLYDKLVEVGWNETSPVVWSVTINAGVFMRAGSVGSFGFSTGPGLPLGSSGLLTNKGFIDGAGGTGGDGGADNETGLNGEPGGYALNIEYDLSINNSLGVIRAGGAGGGGGGGSRPFSEPPDPGGDDE